MNREYDPTKPYNPANKVFVFFLVIIIVASIIWSMAKNSNINFKEIWNELVEDFTTEETTTTDDNYDYYYSSSGNVEDVFNHTNELVDLLNFKIDDNTNFQNLDLSNHGVSIKATCTSYYNRCYSYTLSVEGIEVKVYPTIDKLDHLYYTNKKLITVTDNTESNNAELRIFTGSSDGYGTYISAALKTSNGKNIAPIMYDNKLYYVYGYKDEVAPDQNGYVFISNIDLTENEIVESYLGQYSVEG